MCGSEEDVHVFPVPTTGFPTGELSLSTHGAVYNAERSSRLAGLLAHCLIKAHADSTSHQTRADSHYVSFRTIGSLDAPAATVMSTDHILYVQVLRCFLVPTDALELSAVKVDTAPRDSLCATDVHVIASQLSSVMKVHKAKMQYPAEAHKQVSGS